MAKWQWIRKSLHIRSVSRNLFFRLPCSRVELLAVAVSLAAARSRSASLSEAIIPSASGAVANQSEAAADITSDCKQTKNMTG